ncbi:hypothetical protein PU06_20205 [Escherichia coli]|uniref:hypothetical protein n=1 Tax=Escherichia coli TaxID=562 RepID=UPI0005427219|nr:hypothetical protein [Escherichia coli]EFB2776526.1 hypothetical protein [Escherichia coli]EFC5285161.1 hypothetical protein [Escherichia coli]EFH8689091.1 hypothetical protein [Escherichia coli]EGH5500415.1 hypothetical protein [Escherichia coli]EHX5988438.1 hypothetical protein [Escherichia coli]
MTITEADMLEIIRSIAEIKQPASKINRCSAPVSVVLQQERHQHDDVRPYQWKKPNRRRKNLTIATIS